MVAGLPPGSQGDGAYAWRVRRDARTALCHRGRFVSARTSTCGLAARTCRSHQRALVVGLH